jgi:nicotinate-nucleotide adenylyltransferase
VEAIERFRDRPGLKLGVMGGTFDPVHIGHLVTADEALCQFDLDEIVFVPTGAPPHKGLQSASPDIRHLMVHVAVASHPHFWVSRLEIDRAGTDYTVDTLAVLKALLRPDARLFFITGADAVLDILGWKDPEGILALCTLICATRPGYDLGRLAGVLAPLHHKDRVVTMEIPALAISSSIIRARVAAGRGARYLVPEGVAQLIDKLGLYRRKESFGSEAGHA